VPRAARLVNYLHRGEQTSKELTTFAVQIANKNKHDDKDYIS
jgi:hypothetical protein